MAIYRQWWVADKSYQITTLQSVAGVAPGTTVGPTVVWIFNDKGSLQPDTTTMSGYRLIAEASYDGVNWMRSGPDILNQAWIQVAITGIDSAAFPAMPAQSTGYTSVGAGRSVLLSDIPKGCGRQITYQVIVPLGGSTAGLRWRLVAEPLSDAFAVPGRMGVGALHASNQFHAQGNSAGAVMSLQNMAANGFVGCEYYDNNGVLQFFMGYNNGAPEVRFNAVTSDPIRFMHANVTRFEVTSTNFGFGGASYGGGSGVIYVANRAAAPSSNPVGGHLLYAEAGALKGRGSSGTITTIAAAEPHCPQCDRDVGVLESVNATEEYFFICVPCLIDDLTLAGKPYVVREAAVTKRPKREGASLAAARSLAAGRARRLLEEAKHHPEPPADEEGDDPTGPPNTRPPSLS